MEDLVKNCMKKIDAVKAQATSARRALKTPLEYEVVEGSPVYQEPVPQREGRRGAVRKGDRVLGYPGSAAWISTDRGWVPVRSMGPDRELILHALWPELELRRKFTDALEVSWRGVEAVREPCKVLYSLEWRPFSEKPSKAAGNCLSSEATATMRGLPAGTSVQLRVGARLSGDGVDIVLSGGWQNFQTEHRLPTASDANKSNGMTLIGLKQAGFLPKRHLRGVRAGTWCLEFRMNEVGDCGVFTRKKIPKNTPVEVCPILKVDTSLVRKSPVLKKLTIPVPHEADAFAIPLGYARLYAHSKTETNIDWGHLGGGEILLWASEDIEDEAELFLNLKDPQDTGVARPRPVMFQPPAQLKETSASKFNGAGYINHGNSGVHGRGVFAAKAMPAGQLLESPYFFELDEAGAEALRSYRWGSKGSSAGPFYVPMGLGCLYNHSEQPNACVKLDLGRNVLEYELLEPLHVGQEIFINYGNDYFDRDYSGNNKDEFLDIKKLDATDTDTKIYVALLEALDFTVNSAAIQQELTELWRTFDPQKAEASEVEKVFGKAISSYNDRLLQVQLPVLERFGYRRDGSGWFKMVTFCSMMYFDARTTAATRELSHKVTRGWDMTKYWEKMSGRLHEFEHPEKAAEWAFVSPIESPAYAGRE